MKIIHETNMHIVEHNGPDILLLVIKEDTSRTLINNQGKLLYL